MIGYHTLGYILYNYDYITVYVSCVDIFLDLSANISRYFLGILQTKRAVATPSGIADAMPPVLPLSLTRHLPPAGGSLSLRGRLSQLTVTPRLPPRGSWHSEAVTEGVATAPLSNQVYASGCAWDWAIYSAASSGISSRSSLPTSMFSGGFLNSRSYSSGTTYSVMMVA